MVQEKVRYIFFFCIGLFLCSSLQGQVIPYSIAIGNENKYATLLSAEDLQQANHLLIQHDTRVKYWKNRAKLPLKIVFYTKNDSLNSPDVPIKQTEIIVYNPKSKSKISVDITNAKKMFNENACFVSVETFPLQWYINNGYLTENTYFYMDQNNKKWYILPQLKCFNSPNPIWIYLHKEWKENQLNNKFGNFRIVVLKR